MMASIVIPTFNEECQAINAHYGKNQTHSEIKAHHYIISFDPRDRDAKAGNKHHVTNGYLSYLKQAVIEMYQDQDLYQVDLLSPARVKITDREYWAKRRGQVYLDKQNAECDRPYVSIR